MLIDIEEISFFIGWPQVGGGLAGAMIVDDNSDSSLASVEDTVLVLQQLRFGSNPDSRMSAGPMTEIFDHKWLAAEMGDRLPPIPHTTTT